MPSLDLPADWNLVDIRWPIPGNSFEWGPDNIQKAAAIKRLVIHATASPALNEDGFTMADFHMRTNNWPGIGVNFVVTKDAYTGRGYPGGSTPAGAQIQYVGDALSIRAGVWGMNEGSLHIEISGLFTPGNPVPSANQLRNVRHLIDKILEKNNVFPSMNYYNQIVYHNQIALPGHGTECPGWQHPQFNDWFSYLQGGAFPDHLYAAPAPAPLPTPTPEPVPVIDVIPPAPETPVEASDLVPGKGGLNDYEATYRDQPGKKTIARPGAVAVALDGSVVAQIPEGQEVDIAGYFDHNGHTYARTVYSQTHNLWNGVDTVYFDLPTGNTDGVVPVVFNPQTEVTPNPVVIPDEVQANVTDQQLQEATVPVQDKRSIAELIKELFAQILALIIRKRKKS